VTAKRRILIIDDEVDLAWMLKLNLERTTLYEVRIEADPENAISLVREFAPDLILLDFVLPHLNGGELAAQIKAALQIQVPIVFLTAALPHPEPGSNMRTIAGYRFLSKPVGFEQLLACVSAELEHGATH